MNLVEHYIEKVISVEDVTKQWEDFIRKDTPNFVETDSMLEIKMLVNCYGNIKETTQCYHKSEWDKIQEQGYYMA